jgi:hypothetical protein
MAVGVRGAEGLRDRFRAQTWSCSEDLESAPICSLLDAGVVRNEPAPQAAMNQFKRNGAKVARFGEERRACP